MRPEDEKVTVDVSADIVSRLRDALGAADTNDAEVIERALNAYLLGRLLDRVQARTNVGEPAADQLARDEVDAARQAASRVA